MELLGEKTIKLQDARYKLGANNSNEASIFLSGNLVDSLNIEGKEKMEFKIEKDDVLKLLCFTFSFNKPIYYKRDRETLDEKWFNKQLNLINTHYHSDYNNYIFSIVKQTQGRNYFKSIEQKSGFNIRDLFIEDHVKLVFYKSEGVNLIKIYTIYDRIDFLEEVELNNNQDNIVMENTELRKFAFESFKFLHNIFGDSFLKEHLKVTVSKFNDVENYKTFLFPDFFSDRLLAAFSSERNEENLKDRSGRIRYFLENLKIIGETYVYFSTEWSFNGQSNLRFDQLVKFIESYSKREFTASGDGGISPYKLIQVKSKMSNNKFNFEAFLAGALESNLKISRDLVTRFISSLLSKPFLLLTGLSGSGKTKLAQAFAQWICESPSQFQIIPVGADWTNREPLLGYPNGLISEEYVMPDSGALQIIINAHKPENIEKPFFLILDEMNLSHVERYFADFLSVMETGKEIKLYDGQERKPASKDSSDNIAETFIPKEIAWPKNLYIIGTVNIDETTYMFSPKVLDRANVIEFRVTSDDMNDYLKNNTKPDLQNLHSDNNEKKPGLGAVMARDFVKMSWEKPRSENASDALNSFFPRLKEAGAEFGYRSASEINTLVGVLEKLDKSNEEPGEKNKRNNDFIDIAIMQKLLPKLHGSRSKLVPVLASLGKLCIFTEYEDSDKGSKQFINDFFDSEPREDALKYRISFDKLKRMYKNVVANGFTSYAEA